MVVCLLLVTVSQSSRSTDETVKMSWTPRMFSKAKDENATETPRELKSGSFAAIPPKSVEELKTKFGGALEEIRELLKDELAKEENAIYDDDIWILRFMMNPKYGPEKCAERYKKMIQLREENKLNEIREKILVMMEETPVREVPKLFPHYETVNRSFPESLWHTSDKWGQPVAVQLLGKSELKPFVANMNKDTFYEYTLWKAEYVRLSLDKIAKETGTFVQWVQVIDLNGMGMKHMNSTAMEILKSASTRVDQMYKECFGPIMVCNAPRVFHMLWSMVKIWLNERTKVKVSLMGSNFRTDLATAIPTKEMPSFLGGDVESGEIAFLSYPG